MQIGCLALACSIRDWGEKKGKKIISGRVAALGEQHTAVFSFAGLELSLKASPN